MKHIARILTIILAGALLISAVSCTGETGTTRKDIPPEGTFAVGLTSAEDGTIMLNGTPVQAFGVNMYDPFVNHRVGDASYDVEAGFKALKEAGIPVARVNIGAYEQTVFSLYYYSPDQYFEALDAVIAAAEKYEIGIFASMCWNMNIIWDFVGETCDHIAIENSKTVQLAKKYFTDVVKRYKDSPAIWAWEFGNEYNLSADLCFVMDYAHITSENINKYYSYVSAAIRAEDPYRLIVGGDSELSCRPAALRKEKSWRADTLDDIVESTLLYAPSPMEAVSSHMYQYGTAGKTDIRDFDTVIATALEACKITKKGYYIGEYGPGDFINNGSGTEAQNKEIVDLIHDAALKNKVSITLGWICTNDFKSANDIKDSFYKYWYDEISRINSELKASGAQDNIAEYWAQAKKSVYQNSDDVFTKCTDILMGKGNPAIAKELMGTASTVGSWSFSTYETNATVTLEDAVLADNTEGKVFRLKNNDASAKSFIKLTKFYGLEKGAKYKIVFYLKTSGMEGEGLQVKMAAPTFADLTGIKCDTEGQWQLMELEFDGPEMEKSSYSLGFYLTEQVGDVSFYGIRIIKL